MRSVYVVTVLFGSIGASLYTSRFEQSCKEGLEAWQAASEIYSHFSFQTKSGTTHVETDWSKIVELYSYDVGFISRLDNVLDFGRRYTVPIDFSVYTTENRLINDVEAVGAIELFLYHFFVAMNLSVPGCCTLEGVTIIRPEIEINTPSPPPRWRPAGFPEASVTDNLLPMKLTSLSLIGALDEADKFNWPCINYLPLSKTKRWLDALGTNYRQIAANICEQAVFALMHLCEDEKGNPTELLWIAHALEALYRIPPNQITKTFVERICQVLNAPPSHQKVIKKHINNFYRLRSEFVHGSLPIAHPLMNEGLDANAEDHFEKIMEAHDFGLMLLLATLQKYISNSWVELKFTETYDGVLL